MQFLPGLMRFKMSNLPETIRAVVLVGRGRDPGNIVVTTD